MDLKEIKCFVLDMDGTFYLGESLIKGAKEFIEILDGQGKDYYFLTNNSSKGAYDYQEKLLRLGCDVPLEKIITSGMATTSYLIKQKKNAKVFLMGTPSLEKHFEDMGFVLSGYDKPDFVVLGFDTTLTYQKLWTACDYIREGIPYIATHPDYNCPLEGDRVMPDIGAMIAFIEASTGEKPKVIGKPNKEVLDVVYEITGYSSKDLAIVGDRLYTDIATGINGGITSILVLSGETKKEDVDSSSFEPSYIFPSIKELGEALKSA